MLTGHDAIKAHVPHHGRAMSAGFELVINLLALVGTFNGSATLVNVLPCIRTAHRVCEKTEIAMSMGVVRSPVFGVGTTAGRGTSPLPTAFGFLKSVGFHLIPIRANGNAFWRNDNVAAGLHIFLGALI